MTFDGKVLIVPNFLTEEERAGLYAWSVESAEKRDGRALGVRWQKLNV